MHPLPVPLRGALTSPTVVGSARDCPRLPSELRQLPAICPRLPTALGHQNQTATVGSRAVGNCSIKMHIVQSQPARIRKTALDCPRKHAHFCSQPSRNRVPTFVTSLRSSSMFAT